MKTRDSLTVGAALIRSLVIITYISTFGVLFVCSNAWTEIIPAGRRIEWAPGVRGDIPNRVHIFANVKNSPYNAYGDGVHDDTAAIQKAINDCPPGQVVLLPAGKYMISSQIKISKGITLRGEGPGVTILKGSSAVDDDCLVKIFNPSWDYDLVTSSSLNLGSEGLSKGSRTIHTLSSHSLKPGDYVLIDQSEYPTGDPPITNDGVSGPCTWCGRSNGNRPIGQWAKVTGTPDSKTIEIDPPLYWNYDPSKSPQAIKINGVVQDVGVESITIDNTDSGTIYTLRFCFAINCWALNVELIGSYRRHIYVYGGLWDTIRNCVLHEGVPPAPTVGTQYGPDRAYGIFLGPWTTAALIENNIFYHLSFGISLEGAPSGNVIAYNYFNEFYYPNETWQRVAIGHHGAHPLMNLIEGNWLEGLTLEADSYWGTSSHTTIFRNRQINSEKSCGPWGIDLFRGAHYFNIVGNVLGSSTDNTYELEDDNFAYCNGDASVRSIFKLGYVDGGDNDPKGNDAGVKSTLLRHGNWDSVSKSVVWDPSIADREIPPSLYLNSKPTWWTDLPWPVIGPDLSPMASSIPSKQRFELINSGLKPPSNLKVIQ